jgi:hypothetical protein
MMNTVQRERRGSKPTRDTSPELPQESSNIGFRDRWTAAFTKKIRYQLQQNAKYKING